MQFLQVCLMGLTSMAFRTALASSLSCESAPGPVTVTVTVTQQAVVTETFDSPPNAISTVTAYLTVGSPVTAISTAEYTSLISYVTMSKAGTASIISATYTPEVSYPSSSPVDVVSAPSVVASGDSSDYGASTISTTIAGFVTVVTTKKPAPVTTIFPKTSVLSFTNGTFTTADFNTTSTLNATSATSYIDPVFTSVVTEVTVSTAATPSLVKASTTVTANVPAATNQGDCHAWEFLTIRGASDSQTDPYWMGDYRRQVMGNVSGGFLYEVAYPASEGDVSAVIASVLEGGQSLSLYAQFRAMACPNTKFIVAGFSEGAGATIMGLNSMASVFDRIVGITLWGSPFWTAGRLENKGSATEGAGRFSFLPQRVPGPLEAKTNDFCLYSDEVCTGSTPLGRSTHLDYKDSQWQDASIAWMVSKLHEAGFN